MKAKLRVIGKISDELYTKFISAYTFELRTKLAVVLFGMMTFELAIIFV